MSIKVELTKKEIKNKKYPYIGCRIDSDLLVLFTGPQTGIVLHSYSPQVWFVGEYRTDWTEDAVFKPFKGEVRLSNE